jgi:protein-S-isoprenylcysteine O-methyltransferase Ste14
MDDFLHNLKTIHAKNARADALIASAIFAYLGLVCGVLLLTPSALEAQVMFDIWVSRNRDGMGQLSTYSAYYVWIATFGSLLVIIFVVHPVLAPLFQRFSSPWWLILAGLVVAALLLQQILLDYRAIAAARLPLDAEPGAPQDSILAIAEWQSWARLPIYLGAVVIAAWGTHLIKGSVRRLINIRQLKVARLRTQDVAGRYNRLHLSGLHRDQAAAERRSVIRAATTKKLWREAQNRADEVDAYLRGPNLGRSIDSIMGEALDPDAPPADPAVQELAQAYAPPRLNLALLPSDAAHLAPETRRALREYTDWIRKTYHPENLTKELR